MTLASGNWSVLAPVNCYVFSLLLFILSFAWDLWESKDKHISALCLPYKDKSIQLCCTLNCHILSSVLFLFQCTYKKDTLSALSKKVAEGIETYLSGGWDVTLMQLQTGERTRNCLVLLYSTDTNTLPAGVWGRPKDIISCRPCQQRFLHWS